MRPHPTSPDEIAEDLIGWLVDGPGLVREERDDVIRIHRPMAFSWYGVATRVRAAGGEEADALIADTRAWFASRGRTAFTWMLGEHATPDDMGERLVAAGATPEGTLTAMVLDREPPSGPADVEVRPVETFDEFLEGERIAVRAFGFDGEDAATLERDAREAWDHWQAQPGRVVLLAWVDGRPVAEATLSQTRLGPLVLSGGSTLPEARGRGVYTALTRWRWDEAVRRGSPTLIVQASDSARPVLERLGFRVASRVRVYGDRA